MLHILVICCSFDVGVIGLKIFESGCRSLSGDPITYAGDMIISKLQYALRVSDSYGITLFQFGIRCPVRYACKKQDLIEYYWCTWNRSISHLLYKIAAGYCNYVTWELRCLLIKYLTLILLIFYNYLRILLIIYSDSLFRRGII